MLRHDWTGGRGGGDCTIPGPRAERTRRAGDRGGARDRQDDRRPRGGPGRGRAALPGASGAPAAAEADFSFAGLSDLVRSRFDEVRDELPPPQREALEVALLLRDADMPADPRTTAGALLTAVALLGRRGPLVILVDDVQWLDLASRRAVQYLARRMPHGSGWSSRVAASPLRMAIDLEGALPPGDVERLVLRPLSLAALHQLISSRLQLQLSRPMLVRIAEASDGNPFFALELAGAIAREGTQPGPGDRLPVPRSLHELLRARMDRLSPAGADRGDGRGGALAPERRDAGRSLRIGSRGRRRAARGRGGRHPRRRTAASWRSRIPCLPLPSTAR